MKKFLLSIAFIAGFAAWTIHLHNASAVADTLSAINGTPSGQSAVVLASSKKNPVPTPKPTPAPTPTPTPTPTPAPTPKPTGKFVDGTYTGSVADAYYGYVQVQAIIQGGKLANINFLQYPNDRSTSRQIAAYSLPRLRQEAIQSQSAQVSTISGATDDSGAFRQSLSSALSKAARA